MGDRVRRRTATILLCQFALLFSTTSVSADVLNALGNLMARPRQEPLPQIVEVIAQDKQGIGRGSGTLVYVDATYGYILTNWHVVAEGEQIDVNFPDGFTSPGTTVRTDANWDLALVRIWRPQVVPLMVAGVVPQPGDTLTIAGYGQGAFRAARGKCIHYAAPDTKRPFEMVEVSVEARQGDSGGPILNERGELAGVLFGAGDGATTGSHIGRVKTFLDETFIEQQRLAQGLPSLAAEASPLPKRLPILGPSTVPPAFVPLSDQQPNELPPMSTERLVDVPPRPDLHEPSVGEVPVDLPTANEPVAELNRPAFNADSDVEPTIQFPPVESNSPILADSIIPPPTMDSPASGPPNQSPRIAAHPPASIGQIPLPSMSIPGQVSGRTNGLYGTRGFTLNRSLAERLWEATKSVLAIVGAVAIIFQFAKASVRNKSA